MTEPMMTPPADFDLGLVASDIDGTLLLDWKPIATATIDAIHRCQDMGIPFVLVTGRPIRWLEAIAAQIPDLGRVICLNGAVVYDIASASVISADTIEFSDVDEIVSTITSSHPEAHFAFETLTGGLVDKNFISRNPRHAQVLEDLSELATRDVVKILVSTGSYDSEALHDLIDPLVAANCHASFSSPVNGLVELAPAGVTKAKTLENLCNHLGVAREQVLAFGDMPNDIEMLTWAGHGVAMGNALQSVKDCAATVTHTVDEDGVAHYLNAALDAYRR